MMLLRILILVIVTRYVTCDLCPDGQEAGIYTSGRCIDENGFFPFHFNGTDNLCCKLNCSETGLPPGFLLNEFKIYWKWDSLDLNYHEELARYYKKELQTNVFAACPIPFSVHIEHNYDWQYAPVGLVVDSKINMSAKVKHCHVSTDCGQNEYCGFAFNEFVCHRDKKKIPCVAINNDRKPIRYCYQYPNIGENHTPQKQKIGLAVCNEDIQCSAPSHCLTSEDRKYKKVDSEGKESDGVYKGLCVETQACDDKIHTSRIGTLGKNQKECKVDDACPIEGSECIQPNFMRKNFCCGGNVTITRSWMNATLESLGIESYMIYYTINGLLFYIVSNIFITLFLFYTFRLR